MTWLQALILGVVEGLTEFIPVSSTGHLILVSRWLGLDSTAGQKAAVDAFDIVIQAGAIAACAIYYRRVYWRAIRGVWARDAGEQMLGMRLLVNLGVAFVPIAAIGLVARKPIKALLFNPTTVATTLILGGVAMLVADRWARRGGRLDAVQKVTPPAALKVGLFQCLALVPGTSRSMSTILGGVFAGMNARVAADFSFLLSVPVLGAATGYELLKEWHGLVAHVGPTALVVGLTASFVVGWASIAVFLRLLARVGLGPFGVYRVIAGVVVALTLGAGGQETPAPPGAARPGARRAATIDRDNANGQVQPGASVTHTAAFSAPPFSADLTMLILAVDDVPRAVRFYRRAFGWRPRIEVPVFVELEMADGRGLGLYTRAAFARNTAHPGAAAPARGTTATELYLHVDDLDAAVAAVIAAGGRELSPRAERPWGDEAAYFADPDGNVVVVARRLAAGASSGPSAPKQTGETEETGETE